MADKKTLIKASIKLPYSQWVANNYSNLDSDRQDAILRAREHGETLKHRGWWSKSLIGIVIAINAVSLIIVLLIGMGKLKYNTDLAVPSIIAANFIETWALTKIAMKFYFTADNEDKK